MIAISQLLLTFLLNACWQIALITIAAVICARLLSGAPARYRHTLWVATLLIAFFLPVLTSCVPLLRDSFLYGQSKPQTTHEQEIVRSVSLPPEKLLNPTQPRREAISVIVPIEKNIAIVLVISYLLLVFYRSFKLFRAWRWTRVIARSSYHAEFTDHIETAFML